ncbi:zinc finger protein 420-like [Heterodontus francisci]|uniref:zinc finger protein 420-like n=1 Tax=Heterodontus francisci TaxID=7792 RepID=UPI00355BA6A7
MRSGGWAERLRSAAAAAVACREESRVRGVVRAFGREMEETYPTVPRGAAVSDTGRTGSGKPFVCPTCGDHFKRPHALQQHQRIHTGQRALPEMSFTRSAAAGSFQLCNNGERFSVCDVCGKGFTVAALLARHQAGHTGGEPLACARCGQTFALAASYRRHRQLECHGRSHRCSDCHARFASQDQLELHRRRHALQYSFVCRQCGQGFSRSHYLDRHARLHEAEAPGLTPSAEAPGPTPGGAGASTFICHLCGDSFARWCSLQRHRCAQPDPMVRAEGEPEPAPGHDK